MCMCKCNSKYIYIYILLLLYHRYPKLKQNGRVLQGPFMMFGNFLIVLEHWTENM